MKKLLLISQILLLPLMAQSTQLKRSVSATTSVQAESETYKLSGTIGQNVIGVSAVNQVKISSGYWGWIARWGALGTDEELIIPTAANNVGEITNPFEGLSLKFYIKNKADSGEKRLE